MAFNGAALTAIRTRTGLTQSDLARATGISQGHISQLESAAQTNPRPGTVKKIAEALAVPITALISIETAA